MRASVGVELVRKQLRVQPRSQIGTSSPIWVSFEEKASVSEVSVLVFSLVTPDSSEIATH